MKRKIKIIIAILTAIIAVCVCNKSMDLIEIKDTLLRPFGNIIFIFMVIAIIYIGITKKAEKLLNKKLLKTILLVFKTIILNNNLNTFLASPLINLWIIGYIHPYMMWQSSLNSLCFFFSAKTRKFF